MLIATESSVFKWRSGEGTPTQLLNDGGAGAMAEGNRNDVLALKDALLWVKTDGGCDQVASPTDSVTSLLILGEQPPAVLLGTREAHLHRWEAASTGPVPVDGFEQLECRADWYTPWGGPPSIRSLASAADGEIIYADIHVGSIMRSENGGRSWSPVEPQLDEDVHQVATCPIAPDRVYANTASAVFVSEDRGRSWAHRGHDLQARYGRAIAVNPADPDGLLASVSDGPHEGRAQLYRSVDGGRHWTHVVTGFPASSPGNIDTFHIAFGADRLAWVALGSLLYRSDDRGESWRVVWQAPQSIRLLACHLPA